MTHFLQSPGQILVLGSLTLLSLADLRFRALPGIKIFFLTAVVFGIIETPWKVLAVLLVVGWGMERASMNLQPRLPVFLVMPALFYPNLWPAILTAEGTRRKIIARGDLLAIGGIACLLDGYGPLLALLGALFWRRFWRKGQSEDMPALPGMLLGVFISLWVSIMSN